MFHGTLTLLSRSLRLDAKQMRAHAFRFVSVALVFLFLMGIHIETQGHGAPGLKFFSLICLLCFGLITVAGAGHFASAITEEKEAGTLNLLILANVPPLAILVGKSTTRIVTVLLLFVGIFPFALLALALGGATAHQVFSGLLALAAYLVLVANIGLFASVVSRNGPSAALKTILALTVLLSTQFAAPRAATALTAIGWATSGSPTVHGLKSLTAWSESISILSRINRIRETGFNESAWSSQVILSLMFGLILFLGSWVVFRRFCEYLGDDTPGRAGLMRVRSGQSLVRRLITPRCWRHAMAWKDFNFLVGGVAGILGRTAAIPLLAVGLDLIDRLLQAGISMTAADSLRVALLSLAGIEVIALAARIFNSEFRRQTLCTLVLLPRSTLYLCSTKVLGCSLVLLPYAFWFVLSIFILPMESVALSKVYLLDPVFVAGLCLVLTLSHLTAWLSLQLKWGALPLAVVILMVGSTCLTPFLWLGATLTRGIEDEKLRMLIPMIYLTLLFCSALAIAIGIRFRRAAAE